MSYQNAILELRQIIADTASNKRTSGKRLIGNVDGVNKVFTTYDKRIVATTLQVFEGDTQLNKGFSLDDAIAGQISFTNAPAVQTVLTATYYWQWWLDAEVINFLNKGAETCGIVDPNANVAPPLKPSDQAYLLVPGGLKAAVLKIAASYAFDAIAAYMFARRHSSEYLVEQDGNDDEGYSKLIDSCNKMSASNLKNGMLLRDDFYKSQGRQYKPSQQIKVVGTKQYGPSR